MSNLKRFLSLTLAMLMVVGAMATVSAKSFTDVAATDPYAEAVDVLSELGVIAGATTTEFAPDALVERQQMAMFIARLATAKPAWFAVEAAPVYADQTAPVYNAAIAYANTNGIIVGRTATSFDGAASVNLQEAATMMCRALGYYSNTMNAAYPMSYLMMADDLGLLAGLDDVAPTAALTRGEVAIMLYNAFDAKMAVVTPIYGPNGVDRIVEIPTTDIKKLSTSKWDCKVFEGAFIDATLKAGIDDDITSATKSIKDPVSLNKDITDDNLTNDKDISFASISKFFAEDVTAEDMLGVELNLIVRNSSIIKIDVIGTKTVTTSASYNKDTKVITVDGNDYNLSAYLTATYPAESDNCIYKYTSNKIERIEAIDDTTYAQIANGFFTFEVINEGLATQMLVYKPQSFALLNDTDANGVLEAGVAVVTSNDTGAVKGDYVTYFNGGDKNVVVTAKATKSAATKVSSISLTANKATLDDGTIAPAKAAQPIPGSNLIALSINDTIYVYTVDGVVLKTSYTDKVNAPYTPNTYYKVLNTTEPIETTDAFGVKTIEYKIKVVDNAGNVSIKAITNFNDADTAITNDSWGDLTSGDRTDITDAIITLDGAKAYTTGDKFNGYTVVDGNNVYAAEVFTNTGAFSGQNGVYADATERSFVLTDYSKIVIASTEADSAPDKYLTFTGKTFTKLAEGASFSSYNYVLYKNAAGIYELVYMYAKADVASTLIIDGSAGLITATPYLFIDIETMDSKSVTYKAINLATGATESVVYTDADGDYTKVKLADNKLLNNAIVICVSSDKKMADSTKYETEQYFKLTSSGYVSINNSTIYQTSGTKFYDWNNDAKTFVAKTFAELDKNVSYCGLVVAGTNGNAGYVIIRGKAATAAGLTSVATLTDTTPGTASPIAWEISVANAKATLGLADIAASDGATINLYTNANFTDDEITGTATTDLVAGTPKTVYIKVTSQDLLTVTQYAVTITRAAA